MLERSAEPGPGPHGCQLLDSGRSGEPAGEQRADGAAPRWQPHGGPGGPPPVRRPQPPADAQVARPLPLRPLAG
eukprot:1126179-Prorocentrum_minimum.AAC.2